MISRWTSLRSLVYLKRCAIALEEISDSLSAIADRVKRDAAKPKGPKLREVFTPSVEDMNDMWRERGTE